MREIDRTLRIATVEGDIPKIKHLVRVGGNINAGADTGSTPLIMAIGQSSFEVIQCLIERGAIVNLSNENNGMTPLHAACASGRLKVVQLLLRHGASVNARRKLDGSTPLMLAIKKGKPEIARFLVEVGADITLSRYSDGYTPLHIACDWVGESKKIAETTEEGKRRECDALELVTCLLDVVHTTSGSSVIESIIHSQDHFGATPLNLACKHEYASIVKLLLQQSKTKSKCKVAITQVKTTRKSLEASPFWTACKKIVKTVKEATKASPSAKLGTESRDDMPLLFSPSSVGQTDTSSVTSNPSI